MINKQNIWFITLFSLIMVLSIYYLTMSNDELASIPVNTPDNNKTEVVVTENDTLVSLKVASEEELLANIEELENVLLNTSATLEEKNNAYDQLQNIKKNESEKEAIEKLLKNKFKLDSHVSIKDNNIKITISSNTHDTKLANNIIRCVQELYDKEMYITVKFTN